MSATDRPILVVDDDENVRNLVAEVLLDEGIGHVLAAGGTEAIEERLGEADFALVVTDLMMAEGDGLDVVHALGRIRPDLPVVVMSALMDEIEVVTEVEGEPNVAGWLRKPLDIEELRALVLRLLAR